jgi:hypothetical protein
MYHLVKQDLKNTMALARTGYMDHLVKDIKILLHLDKCNGYRTCSKSFLVSGHQHASMRQG